MEQSTSNSKLQQPDGTEESVGFSPPVTPFESPMSNPVVTAPLSQRTTLAKRLFWSFAFVLTTTVSASIGASVALLTPLAPSSSPEEQNVSLNNLWQKGLQYKVSRPVNILVMGVDRVPGVTGNSSEVFDGRSDTMLLLHVDPKAQSVSMLSIPRDTQVEIPGIGITKVNQANASGGPALTARVVSRTLNDVPIDRYVRVSTDAFREIVDLLGGVDVFVPTPMAYVDQTQKLKIDLAQGWQTLNGEQAEGFARFRNDAYGDIGRVQRQQALIKALRDRLTSPSVLPRLPKAIRIMRKYIDTNLSLEEMLSLIGFGLNLERDQLKMVMLPGRFSQADEYIASYWLMDDRGRDRVMREFFKIDSSGLALDNQYRLASDSAPQGLRIAIQNASGQPDLGSRVAQLLENQGFPNVYIVQDWPDHQRQTQIIVQQGDLEGAAVLKKAIGLGNIEATSTGDLESDLTIRIGEDWLQKGI
ncbi:MULTISPECIES: LCP family protein [Trichocoleus]|uniref:LCP family protein n=1 Tax=Trichocoleus TaxID=450526 RepID=UPI0028C3D4AA|nr:LCP family protein [Trichocoleus sp. FACHB-262]